ncbi:MAG TPA: thrombospondin type 3 repeat-containing protein, partial [Nannocystaceae bacterium]|nr:thrombospondin type 3 repeat-containing protein [Nannocystaceae bacterium]
FNNLLEPTTIELVRKPPQNASRLETYDWRTRILAIHGPGTRYSGDWRVDPASDAERVTRLVNLACVQKLRESGIDYVDQPYDDPATNPCNDFEFEPLDDARDGSRRRPAPWKMLADTTLQAPRGRWDDRALGEASELDCEDPQDGADTCCSQCDFALTAQVAKYGLAPGQSASETAAMDEVFAKLARPGGEEETAIACDPKGDRLIECRDFVPWTSRRDETLELFWPNACAMPEGASDDEDSCVARGECEWDDEHGKCRGVLHRVTYADHVRETHPGRREPGAERANAACTTTAECRDASQHDLPGTECIGRNADGDACAVDSGDPTCGEGHCVAEWFVTCRAEPSTTGAQGYCVDTRYDVDQSGGCTQRDASCTTECDRLSSCDADGDGVLADAGCANASSTDPAYATEVVPIPAYDRGPTLPDRTRLCFCDGDPSQGACGPSEQFDDVDDPIALSCNVEGDDQLEDGHDYAVNFVTRLGGVIYEPALKGVQWRPADEGGIPRAAIEACAEQRGLIAGRNVEDGWRAHDADGIGAESYEDFDRAMCSGQVYEVVFADGSGDEDEVLIDKAGNTLAGKSIYRFETPQFHVVPGSGFPTDALRIGECDQFTLQFSNKYDLSPENLKKLVIIEHDTGRPVAGGVSCVETAQEVTSSRPPCLDVDVSEHESGRVGVRIDPRRFGIVLQRDVTYELGVAGLPSIYALDGEDLPRLDPEDPATELTPQEYYDLVFWDVCGMPLVHSTGQSTGYVFTIDPTSCRDDADGDGIPRSCDNADEVPNASQTDLDLDGFGDVADPCPTLATAGPETGDTDRDGVGNACDSCASAPDSYNQDGQSAGVPPTMYARNVPSQRDSDADGIGDVCDNCPTVANCGTYGPDSPYRLGSPRIEDSDLCQADADRDLVGDECEGMQADGAVGPIGFGSADDFDQDGIANQADACPRQPAVPALSCADDDACGVGRLCVPSPVEGEPGVCNHVDSDLDGFGDECDTCPYIVNVGQGYDGAAQAEDEDGDFVGLQCELGDGCETAHGPRPLAFHRVSVAGQCCVTTLVENGSGALVVVDTGEALVDPDGIPVRRDCDDEGVTCRRLPSAIAKLPGVLELPPGCSEALAEAGISDASGNVPLLPKDTDGDLDALWSLACTLPASDHDFDGVGDACDLCPFAYDPDNAPYVDETGKTWTHDGAVCSGTHADTCEAPEDPGGDEAGGDETGGDGG